MPQVKAVYIENLWKPENVPLMSSFTLHSGSITVKATHVVTSVKQSPVLKGHFFVLLYKISYELNLC